MDIKKTMKSIEQGHILPIYVCYGSENYLREQFVSFLISHSVNEEEATFAVSKYDLAEVSIEAVLEDAQTMPFMAEKKVIIAYNALFFTGAKDNSKVSHDLDRLTNYIESPVDYTVLVFIVEADKLDERKKMTKLLKKAEALLAFTPVKAQSLIQWIHQEARNQQISLTEEAVERLILNAGENLQALSSELVKLSLYSGQGGVVGVEQVEALVVRNVEQNVFLLIDHIVNRKLDQALSILDDLMKNREEPIKILMLLARQFRIILQVKAGKKQGLNDWQISSQVGAQPFVVKLASQQGQHYSMERLYQIMNELTELDYQMKSGSVDKILGLELFFLRLAM